MSNQELDIEKYREILSCLKEHFEIQRLRDFKQKKPKETTKPLCLLRHDIDSNMFLAMKLAELEHSMGIHATYFVLHTAEYWVQPEFLKQCLYIQSLGHEIGLHSNIITVALTSSKSMSEILYQSLKFLRDGGIEVYGTASHGDPLCGKEKYVNYQAFEGCDFSDIGWESAKRHGYTVRHPLKVKNIPLYSLKLEDFNLLYEAYYVGFDLYVSDLDSRGIIGMVKANEGKDYQVYEVLMHPIRHTKMWEKLHPVPDVNDFTNFIMTENHPKILVCSPFNNEDQSIPSYIESLKALHYPKDKLDIIWIENDSVDNTKELLQKYYKKLTAEGYHITYRSISFGLEKMGKFSVKDFATGNNVQYGKNYCHSKADSVARANRLIKVYNTFFDEYLTDHEYVLFFMADCIPDKEALLDLLRVYCIKADAGWVGGIIHHRYPIEYKVTPWLFKDKSEVQHSYREQFKGAGGDTISYRPTEDELILMLRNKEFIFNCVYTAHFWLIKSSIIKTGIRFKYCDFEVVMGFIDDMWKQGFKVYCDGRVFLKHVSLNGKIYREKLHQSELLDSLDALIASPNTTAEKFLEWKTNAIACMKYNPKLVDDVVNKIMFEKNLMKNLQKAISARRKMGPHPPFHQPQLSEPEWNKPRQKK